MQWLCGKGPLLLFPFPWFTLCCWKCREWVRSQRAFVFRSFFSRRKNISRAGLCFGEGGRQTMLTQPPRFTDFFCDIGEKRGPLCRARIFFPSWINQFKISIWKCCFSLGFQGSLLFWMDWGEKVKRKKLFNFGCRPIYRSGPLLEGK